MSVVTVPAYRDTSVEVAQRNKGLKEFKEKQKIQIALELESLRLDT